MEICLNTNFSAIENYDLENINGGKSWCKVAAIGIGAVAGAYVSSMASGYSK